MPTLSTFEFKKNKSFMAWPCQVIVIPVSVLRILLGAAKPRSGQGYGREKQ